MKKLLLFILLVCATVQAYSQEYPKVVLSGDYPDPSVMRDGEDYYMTHSPFYYAPGFLIWHSRDLMNWEPVCRVMPEYEGPVLLFPRKEQSPFSLPFFNLHSYC